ncbi:MAG: UDP-3-O-(3-hydroxymyristoyl)glucosamine N-acyltransferase [Phycisphaeraceae bacterium]|nr:UDP-3-O-(3-hydroxymyristoyl)glucosamine N-acyltransferase [Phycisphaeraceae bacterium]
MQGHADAETAHATHAPTMHPGAHNGAPPVSGARPPGARVWTTKQLAELLKAELRGPEDLRIERLDALDRSDERTLTFVRDAKRAAQWAASRAAAAIVTRGVDLEAAPGKAILVVDDADRATITVLEILTPPTHFPGVGSHAQASIDPSAVIDPTAAIGPFVTIGPRTVVGPRVVLHSGVTLGADVRIGEDTELRAGVVVEDRCVIGARVRLHANSVIGADGFGYRPSADGKSLAKIPHAGNVEIHDDVEIGANTNIDRGKFGPTVVGAGTKIDNLVQIGHNCLVGRSVIICGVAAIAGSVRVGDGAILGGGVRIADNLSIGAGARIGAASGVMDDVPPGQTWAGYPARPIAEAMKVLAGMSRLPELIKQVKRLEREAREQ